RPARSRARLVATLNVDPGGYWPTVAADWPLLRGPLATARTAPVDGRIATRALAGLVSARVFSASFCRPTFIVSFRSRPSTGWTWNSVWAGAELLDPEPDPDDGS